MKSKILKSRKKIFSKINKKELQKMTLIILGSFLFFKIVDAKGIFIDELMYNPPGNDNEKEWIEVCNGSDFDVDMSEWRLLENSVSHKLEFVGDNSVLYPQKCALIVDNYYSFVDNYEELPEVIIESEFSLKNDGESVELVDKNNDKVYEILYSSEFGNGDGYSVELCDDKWQRSFSEGGSPGWIDCRVGDSEKIDYVDLRINELLPNPSKSPEKEFEFVEIYNFGKEKIDLGGWKLVDEGKNEFNLSGEIDSGDYIVFYDSVSLNNSGDEIVLLNSLGDVVDEIVYDKAQDNFSYGFKGEGDYDWSPVLTPKEENIFLNEKKDINCDDIEITEIFPNPKGDESKSEFIELFNNSEKTVDLFGCMLSDLSSKQFMFPMNTHIGAKDFLVVYRDDFGFAMNNSGEEIISFLNEEGDLVSSVAYSKAYDSTSFSYDYEKSKWRWTSYVTPDKKNKFNKEPKVDVNIEEDVYVDIKAIFEVELAGSSKSVKVVWDFGDGHRSYNMKTSHKYEKDGEYSGNVRVFNGSEEFVENFDINVKEFPELKVKIISIMPNPKGKDADREWIEIENRSKKSINLKKWIISTGKTSKKLINHLIDNDFIIKAGKSRKLTREYSSFSLGNEKGRIELLYPDKKVAYKVKYKKEGGIGSNEVYEKKNGKWRWIKIEDDKVDEEIEIEKENKKEEVISVAKEIDEKHTESIKTEEEVSPSATLKEEYFGGQSVDVKSEFAIKLGSVILVTPKNKYADKPKPQNEENLKIKRINHFFGGINQTLNKIFSK